MEYTVHLGEKSLKGITDAIRGGSSGGDSEFSTAQVAITFNTVIEFIAPMIGEDGIEMYSYGDSGDDVPYAIILRNGRSKLLASERATDYSENIEENGSINAFDRDLYEYVITGDGTIRFAGTPV